MPRRTNETAEEPPPGGDASGAAGRARDGLEHLQAAARELIEAARAVLDVAEELVDDPQAVARAVATLGSLARAAGRAADGPADRDAGSPVDGAGVERIEVT